MQKTILWILAVAAVTAIGWAISGKSNRPSDAIAPPTIGNRPSLANATPIVENTRSNIEATITGGSHSDSETATSGVATSESEHAATAYPEEFSRIFTNSRPGYRYDVAASLHKLKEEESRDPAWASIVEDHFAAHFATSAELAPYGQPVVECKTSICEVRLSTDRVGDDIDWRSILTTPRPHLNADQGKPHSVNMSWDRQDGTSAVVLHVVYDRAP